MSDVLLWGFVGVACIGALISTRLQIVSVYRMAVIRHAIREGLSLTILNEITYREMILKFWRKPSSFFPPEYRV